MNADRTGCVRAGKAAEDAGNLAAASTSRIISGSRWTTLWR